MDKKVLAGGLLQGLSLHISVKWDNPDKANKTK